MNNNGEYLFEDDDGYFLTPVLHYDLSNKIMEANKRLFDDGYSNNKEDDDDTKINKSKNSKCVTFAQNLESFAVGKLDTYEGINENSVKDVEDDTKEVSSMKKQISLDFQHDSSFHSTTSISSSSQDQNKQKSVDILDEKEAQVIENLDAIFNDEESNYVTQPTTKVPTKNYTHHVKNNVSGSPEIEDDCLSMQLGDTARKTERSEILVKQNSIPSNSSSKKSTAAVNRSNNKYNHKNSNIIHNHIANIKINYKICCEYAAVHQLKDQIQQLPQYEGFISEYGLSRKERERVLMHKERQKKILLQTEMHSQEQVLHKITANEQAFTTWLRNKYRQFPNRTRNMFDLNKKKTIVSKDQSKC